MDKIDNPWFVVSQIAIPLCAFVFSLMYVRRYRRRPAAEGVMASEKESGGNDDPGSRTGDGG